MDDAPGPLRVRLRRARPAARASRRLVTALAAVALAAGCTVASSDAPGPSPSGAASATAPSATGSTRRDEVPETLELDLERTALLDQLGIPDLARASYERLFHTSFEDPADLAGAYATPPSPVTHHEVSTEQAHRGAHAEKGWVTGPGAAGLEVDGPNHRGYPTIALAGGSAGPAVVQLWVWVDVALQPGQWFSFATFTNDTSTRWARVVTVNLDPAGFVDVFHVPQQNHGDLALQRRDVLLPLRRWVRLTAYVDLTEAHGAIAVWQGPTLVAAARVDPRIDGAAVPGAGATTPLSQRLAQAHFGLYAPPEVAAATVFNDDITIAAVRSR